MPDTPNPSGLEDHLGYWLRAVSNAVSLSFARRLEGAGVTVAEWVFLRALLDCDAIAPSHLAERMGMTKGAISRLTDRLEGKGLVQRAANPDDARAQTLALTARGRALVPSLSAIADRNDADFFGALPPDDRFTLGRLLRAIAAAHGLTKPPVT